MLPLALTTYRAAPNSALSRTCLVYSYGSESFFPSQHTTTLIICYFQESDSEDGKHGMGGAGAGGGGSHGDGFSNPSNNDAPDPVPNLPSGHQDDEQEAFGDDDFPPRRLLGPASDSTAQPMFAPAAATAMGSAAVAARRGVGSDVGVSGEGGGERERPIVVVHPVVARRGLDFLWYLCKTSSRVTYDMLTVGPAGGDDGSGGGGAAGNGESGRGGNEALSVLSSPVAESKGKGKGKGRRGGGGSSKSKGKQQSEAMDVTGAVKKNIMLSCQ